MTKSLKSWSLDFFELNGFSNSQCTDGYFGELAESLISLLRFSPVIVSIVMFRVVAISSLTIKKCQAASPSIPRVPVRTHGVFSAVYACIITWFSTKSLSVVKIQQEYFSTGSGGIML